MLELCRSYVESYVKMSYRGSGTVRSYFGGSPFTNAPVHEPFTNRSFIFRRAVPPRSRTGPFTNRSRTVRSYFGGLYPTRSRTGPFTNRSRTVRSNFPLHERTTLHARRGRRIMTKAACNNTGKLRARRAAGRQSGMNNRGPETGYSTGLRNRCRRASHPVSNIC